MRIGVISDTHVPEIGTELPEALYSALRDCELILHCGDIHSMVVIDSLEKLAPVFSARGNGDVYEPRGQLRPGIPEDSRVARTRIFELEGFRVGLVHDLEWAEYVTEEQAGEYMLEVFGEPIDIALCGHTHVPMVWGLPTGTAVLNPGSPTMPYGYWHVLGTVGYLDLKPGEFEFTVVNLASGEAELKMTGPAAFACQRGLRPDWQNSAIRY